MNDLKRLAQTSFVSVATKLTWKTLSKEQRNERFSELWVASILTDNPLLAKIWRNLYDWCLENYE